MSTESAIKKIFFKNSSANVSDVPSDFKTNLCSNPEAFPIPGNQDSVFEALFRRDDNSKFLSAPDVENFLSVSKQASKSNPIKEENFNPVEINNLQDYTAAVDNLISGLVEMAYISRLTYADLLTEGYEKLLEESVTAIIENKEFSYLGLSKARSEKIDSELNFFKGLRKNLVENFTEENINYITTKVLAMDKIMHELSNRVVEVLDTKPEMLKESIYPTLNDYVDLLS